jgi:hypothetical protein
MEAFVVAQSIFRLGMTPPDPLRTVAESDRVEPTARNVVLGVTFTIATAVGSTEVPLLEQTANAGRLASKASRRVTFPRDRGKDGIIGDSLASASLFGLIPFGRAQLPARHARA